MTGERSKPPTLAPAQPGGRAPAQPGGRAPAPGTLALVQSFINTHYDLEHDHGAELWASPAALCRWLRRHGLIGTRAGAASVDLVRALDVREGLRVLAAGKIGENHATERLRRLNAAAAGATVELRFGAQDGPHFVPGADGGVTGALGLVLGIAAAAMIDGRWSRLKMCPGENCGWVFYDASRNGTGRWCSMAVCGARAKARTHYYRHKAPR